jgi:hypothetical protein
MNVVSMNLFKGADPGADVRNFAASVTRFNKEIILMKSLIENSAIPDEDKFIIMSDLVRSSGMLLEILFKYSLSLSKTSLKKIIDQESNSSKYLASDAAANTHQNRNEGAEHGI